MLEKETQKHIRLENLLRMLTESSFIESSIFDLESGFSIVESGFLKRDSEHESGFFPSPGFLRVRVQQNSLFPEGAHIKERKIKERKEKSTTKARKEKSTTLIR